MVKKCQTYIKFHNSYLYLIVSFYLKKKTHIIRLTTKSTPNKTNKI